MALLSFDGSPHGGSHKLLPEWNSQPTITPTQIIDHTIVGSAIGAWWFFHDSTGIESHFIIRGRQSGSADGHIFQLMDTGRQADANLQANARAISIETEDNGARPIEPWSRAQVESLRWLHDRLEAIHPGIKRQNADTCTRPGLGYHSQLGAPSCRTPSVGKDCPAPARISQWNALLLPAFLTGTGQQEDDMTPEQAKQLQYIHDTLTSTADGQDIDLLSKLYRLTTWGTEAKGEGRPNLADVLEELRQIKARLAEPPA